MIATKLKEIANERSSEGYFLTSDVLNMSSAIRSIASSLAVGQAYSTRALSVSYNSGRLYASTPDETRELAGAGIKIAADLVLGAPPIVGDIISAADFVSAYQRGDRVGMAAAAAAILPWIPRVPVGIITKSSSRATEFIQATVEELGTGRKLGGIVDLRATLDRIAAHEANPSNAAYLLSHRNDGSIFRNKEGHLPSKNEGYYTEYVVPTPQFSKLGPQRIVTGRGDEKWYTADHYETFTRIQ